MAAATYQRLQAGRDGQAVPLPEAVDVEVFVTGPDDANEMALNGKKNGRGLACLTATSLEALGVARR